MILGIDEVGRGPWAGPLVVGAVVLPEHHTVEGLTDSKKLSDKKRRQLDAFIREQALGWGLGWVFPDELDEVGLSVALKLATIRAVEAVTTSYHEIIIDGTINFLKETPKGRYVTTMPKADLLIPAVSAASIIAKVARDTYMAAQDELYPEYGFSKHVGYGTAHHQTALIKHGVTPLHRKSFAPISRLLQSETVEKSTKHGDSTTQIGNGAETVAAHWLVAHGFTVIERNWKTKWCEVDIVASKNGILYFVEVKYRSSASHGGGVGAITQKKLHSMQFAAELYLAGRTDGQKQAQLAVMTVDVEQRTTYLEVE